MYWPLLQLQKGLSREVRSVASLEAQLLGRSNRSVQASANAPGSLKPSIDMAAGFQADRLASFFVCWLCGRYLVIVWQCVKSFAVPGNYNISSR